jgi:hypothetical protein
VTGFTLPPRREMPREVRDRLRRNLWRELDAPSKSRLNRARAPLAAAAGVALLAAGAVIIAQATPSTRNALPGDVLTNTSHPTTAASTADAVQANAELDRCYQAAKTSPTKLPDRPQWSASFSAEVGGISVTAARADGKPLFCESTLTTVTVSDLNATPAYAIGSATGALFATPNGTIAGVIDPTWDAFEVRTADGADSLITLPEKADGMFVMYTSLGIGPETKLRAQQLPTDLPPDQTDRPDDDDPQYPVRDIATVPAPMVSVVDRPANPPADRTSISGNALALCMQSTTDPEPDKDSWQPGASATVKGSDVLMAVNAKGVSVCQWQPEPAARKAADSNDQMFQAYMQLVRDPQPVDATQMPVITGGDSGLIILGTIRGDVTRMNVQLDGKVPLDTDVRAGTFVSVVPDSMLDEGQLSDDMLNSLTAIMYDTKGNEVYNGPLHAH